MPVIIQCPNGACGTTMHVPESAVGRRVQCPTCRQPFQVSAPATTRRAASVGVADKCPGCGSPLRSGAIACLDCGLMFQTDAAAAEPKAPVNVCANPLCGVANPPGTKICVRCDDPIPLPVGTLLHGRYRLEKMLKAAGFSVVYRAVDTKEANRTVAIKDMINVNPKESAVRLKFFRREVEVLRALEHVPIVPRVYEFIDQGQVARLVLEFIPGKDLFDVMAQNGNKPFPLPLVIEWGKAICDVLDTMHGLSPQLIHRDLKPANIMLLTDQRSIKMIDFGTARDLGRTTVTRLAKKTLVHTEGYAPIEQIIGKPDLRSDLFALAATLCHLATGKEPDNAHPALANVQNQLNDPRVPAQHRWFYELLRINLAENLNDRYASAAAIKADLEAQRVSFNPTFRRRSDATGQTNQESGLKETLSREGTVDDTLHGSPMVTCHEIPASSLEAGFEKFVREQQTPTPRESDFVVPLDLAPDPLADLQRACTFLPTDWMMILFLATEVRQAGHVMPPEYAKFETQAQVRWDCYQRLQGALGAGKLPKIVEAYEPALLDDWPVCADDVVKARQAVVCWNKVLELRGLVQSSRTGQTLLKRWVDYAPELTNWPEETEPIRQIARSWESRNRGLENLRRVVEEKTPSERSIVQTWEKLQELGGHPDAGAFQDRVRQAALRAACLERLPPRRRPESEEEDGLVLLAWDRLLLEDCPEAQAHKERHDRASERLHIVAKLEAAIAQSDQSAAAERAILEIAFRFPDGYVHRQLARLGEAQVRMRAAHLLEKALRAKPRFDLAIAAAWDQVQASGLRMDKQVTDRCELADRRRCCLQQLGKIDPALPSDRQDQRWMELWNDPLLSNCTDADPLRPAHTRACERIEAWGLLEKAVRGKDRENIISLAANPLLANYPPIAAIKNELDDLLKQANSLQQLDDLLGIQDPDSFVEQLDFEYIRNHPELYTSQRQSMEAIVLRWLEKSQAVGKSDPVSTQDRSTGLIMVRWSWRFFGRITYCRVAVSAERFFETIAEARGQTMQWDAEAHRRAGGGIELPPIPGKRRLFVTVWPAIDLGWTELVGPPLHLGPVRM